MFDRYKVFTMKDFLPPIRHPDCYEFGTDKLIKIAPADSGYVIVVELVHNKEYNIADKTFHVSEIELVSETYSSSMNPSDSLLLEGIYTSSDMDFCNRAMEYLRYKHKL